MVTSLNRIFLWIMRGGALLTLLSVLASGLLQAAATPRVQTDINGPAGSARFVKSVSVLSNANFVVIDPTYSASGPEVNVGRGVSVQ